MKPMISSGKLTDPAGLLGIAPTVPCVTWESPSSCTVDHGCFQRAATIGEDGLHFEKFVSSVPELVTMNRKRDTGKPIM